MTLKNLAKLASESTADRSWLLGRLGRLAADGTTVLFSVSYRTDYVWVRMGPNGDQGIRAAYNRVGVPYRAGLPVRMRRDNGILTIYETDTALLSVDPNAPPNDFGVAMHTHARGAGLTYEVEAERLSPGRVRFSSGVTVYINPFRYYHAGAWQTWEGGTLNLLSVIPATAGHWAWVVMGIDPTTNAVSAIAGSSVVYATALALADLDAVAIGALIPCAAIRLRNDDTVLNDPLRYVDAHGWFGQEADIAATIHAAALDTTPLDADEVPGLDSDASFGLVRWTWTSIKAFLKAYFDTLYNLYVHPNHTGDVTSAGDGATTIAADAVTYAKMQNVSATDKVLGRATAGAGDVEEISMTAAGRALVDDADAAAQRTTLGLGTMALEAATTFLRLLGVAGGQTAHGGTAAGESLTLRGTAHATKGPVIIADDGGNVGVGNGATAPTTPFSVIRTDDLGAPYLATYQGLYQDHLMLVEYYHTGTVSSANKIALDLVTKSSTQKRTTARIAASFDTTTDASRNTLLEIGTAIAGTFATAIGMTGKKLGLFGAAAAPQGPLHVHDGTIGKLIVRKTGIGATPIVVLPNGTGDVTQTANVTCAWFDPTGAYVIGFGPGFLTVPQTVTSSIGGHTYQFRVNADGSVDVTHTVGAGNASAAIEMFWF